MKLHRNAKSTPSSRLLLVRRVLFEGWSYAAAAEGFAVSVRTVAKWVRRFREGGVAALEDASSRPGAPPHQTPPRRGRAHPDPARAARAAGVGDRARAADPAIDRQRLAPSLGLQSARRARRRCPCSATSGRARATCSTSISSRSGASGRSAIGSTAIAGGRRRGIGWEYVHVAIDDHSRVAYVEVLADQLGTTCAAFLRRAVAWLQARGITTRRVMSDNGSGYVSRAWRATCEALGLRHLRTRAYTPRTNGKAERFIQTLLREWAYVEPYASSRDPSSKLRPYVQYYNRQRPHASLGYQAPWSRLTSAA